MSHLNDRKGKSEVNGEFGRKAMNVSAPTVMIGAVYPIALDRPMMMPVRMPPIE